MSIKEFFISCGNFVPLSTKTLMNLASINCILPFYHAVSNNKEKHLKNLYIAKSEKQFRNDLIYLMRWFCPINFEQLESLKTKQIGNNKHYFFLSFDDGLRSYLDVALPILQEYSIPSVNFVNSNFVDNQHLFYRFKVSLLIDKISTIEPAKVPYSEINTIFESDIAKKEELVEWLINCTIIDDDKLNELAILIDVSFSQFLEEEKPFLSALEIKELQKQGIKIGAHSVNHPRYIDLSLKEQFTETKVSIKFVEDKFKVKYKLFSFPFSDDGVSKSFFKKIHGEGITTFGSSGLKDEVFDNHYQRIPMEYARNYSAKQIVKGELFYYFFKKIFRVNFSKRDE